MFKKKLASLVLVAISTFTMGGGFLVSQNVNDISLTVCPTQEVKCVDKNYDFDAKSLDLNFNADDSQSEITTYSLEIERGEHIESVSVTTETGEEINVGESGKWSVEIGKQAVVTVVSKKGYVFNEKTTPVITGSGQVQIQELKDERTIVLNWFDFIGDAQIRVSPTERENNLTIKTNDVFESVKIDNGEDFSLDTDVHFIIKTGESKALTFTLKYGYKNPSITGIEEFLILSSSIQWLDEEKVYTLIVEIGRIDEDKQISLKATQRQYVFNLSIVSGMEFFASLSEPISQIVNFGEVLNLNVSVKDASYGFVYWKINDQILSTNANEQKIVDASLKEILESKIHEEDDNDFSVVATIKEVATEINLLNEGYGEIEFNYIDVEDNMTEKLLTIEENQSLSKLLKLDEQIIVSLMAKKGYHFKGLKINDEYINFEVNDYGVIYENGKISFIIAKSIQKVQFVFEPDEFNLSVKAVVEVYGASSTPTGDGGQVYLCDEKGNKLDNYENESVAIGYDFLTRTHTDATVYLLVESKKGYIPTLTAQNAQVTSQKVNGKNVYAVSKIQSISSVLCTFTARSNAISIKYVLDNTTTTAKAGKFEASTSSNLVNSQINNAYAIALNALTGAEVLATGYTNINYALQTENGRPKAKIVYASGRNDNENFIVGAVRQSNHSKTGFTSNFTINLYNVNEDAIIYIYVLPKVYNLKLFVDENESVEIENGITFGESIALNLLTEQQKSLAFKQKAGYDFTGYYTMQLGQGTKYITADGRASKIWSESGYSFNGDLYTANANFNPETNTFTLFAFWQYRKALINFDFLPSNLKTNEFSQFQIADFVSKKSFNDAYGSVGENNKFYAEIMSGKSLTFSSVSVNGYVFEKWTIAYNAEIKEFASQEVNFSFNDLSYTVTAVYRPTYSLTVFCQNNQKTEGGSAYMVQDGQELNGNSFSSEKSIRIVAQKEEGYDFLYFENTQSGRKYYAELVNGNYYFTLGLQTSPLTLRAVFKGQNVVTNIDVNEIALYHNLIGVYVNNVKKILSSNKLSSGVCVGDEIMIRLQKKVGYGIETDFEKFSKTVSLVSSENVERYTYLYKVAYKDLIIDENGRSLSATFSAPQESVNIMLVNGVLENGEFVSQSIGGKAVLFRKGVAEEKIVGTKQFEASFSESYTLELTPFDNYKLFCFMVNDVKTDFSRYMKENKLIMSKTFMENFRNQRQVTIKICFKIMLWADEESRSSALEGGGTKENPYLVTNASDFGFISYAVNFNLSNERGVKYCDAYYKVTNNINFEGKFYSPIGQQNAFNGYFDLGKYYFSNILLDKSYTKPTTSYRGLFLNLTDNAVIKQDNSKTTLISGILIGVAVGALAIVGICSLIKKRSESYFNGVY